MYLIAACCHNSHSLTFFMLLFTFHVLAIVPLCFRCCRSLLHVFFLSPALHLHPQSPVLHHKQSTTTYKSAVFTYILTDYQLTIPVKGVSGVSCMFVCLLLTCSFFGLCLSLTCLNPTPVCRISLCFLDLVSCLLPACLPTSV